MINFLFKKSSATRLSGLLLFLLFFIELIYVILEFSLSGSLLQISTGITVDPEPLEKFENFGRTLSGMGLGLLIFSLIPPRSGFLRQALTLILSVALSIPAMHFIQDKLVDGIVAMKSTPEDMAKADLAINYRDLMLVNGFREEHKSGNPIVYDIQDQVTLGLFPILAMHSDILNKLKGDENWYLKISSMKMNYLAKEHARAIRLISRDMEYILKAQQVHALAKSPSLEASLAFVRLTEIIERQGQIAMDKFTREQIVFLREVYKQIDQNKGGKTYFAHKACLDKPYSQRQACFGKIQKVFDKRIKSATESNVYVGIPYTTFFCSDGYTCRDTSVIFKRVYKYVKQDWLNRTGIPLNKNLNETYASGLNSNFISDYTHIWKLIEKPQFFKEVIGNIRQYSKQENLFSNTKSLGGSYDEFAQKFFESVRSDNIVFSEKLPFDFDNYSKPLSMSEFLADRQVKDTYKAIMGEFYVPVSKFSYNNREYNKLLSTNYRNIIQYRMNKFKNIEESYANDPYLRKQGEMYIKMIYIPAVAMSISLLFAMMLLLKLPIRILGLCTLRVEESKRSKILRVSTLALTPLVVILPFAISSGHSDLKMNDTLTEVLGHQPLPHEDFAYAWFVASQPLTEVGGSISARGYGVYNHPLYVKKSNKDMSLQVERARLSITMSQARQWSKQVIKPKFTTNENASQ
ncbi:hypothetical protein WMY97_16815 [Vibrio diabolicus]|uniref:hypothetical protein n=1 Tax=Vibrio diabolicus TaxID=50719 RepID=UPI00375230E0